MTPDQRSEYMWNVVATKGDSMMVPWYLILSYLYYLHDIALVPDQEYDKLCGLLDEKFDTVKHRHKYLVDRDALQAGTGFHISKYPDLVETSARMLAVEDGYVRWDGALGRWIKINPMLT